jgi:hypothetical protein
MSTNKESVALTFRHTEKEYLAAVRLYFWNSKELMARLIVSYLLITSGLLVVLPILLGVFWPIWALVILLFLFALGWYHGYLIDVPRRYFRSDPKFHEEYNLTFSDAGIEFKTQSVNASIAWNFYTGVIENDAFYILLYGKALQSLSILPKRVFRDGKEEKTFGRCCVET